MTLATKLTNRQAADEIHAAHVSGQPIFPVKDRLAEATPAAAYEIQKINIDRRIATGQRLIGRKIGLTSVVVQEQLGVSEPDYGALMSDMIVGDGETVSPQRLLQPKAEAEIAFILGADLNMDQPNLADVLRATQFVLPAIEIVSSRIADWKISLVDTIADNASCGLFVLGGPVRSVEDFDFVNCEMEMWIGDQVVSTGNGGACMGSPLNAAVWLANQMQRLGTPLRSGDILMTGALGPMVSVEPGDRVTAKIGGLGSASFTLGK